MEPSIPTSFIPKRPITTEPHAPVGGPRAVGLLTMFTVIVVLGTALSFGYVYLAERKLAGDKAKLAASIDVARNSIGTDFINDMKRLQARIEGVKALLKSHIVVSPIFDALQATTLRSVQYKSFSYAFVTDAGTKAQTVQITLVGSAKSYATIALQSDAFLGSTLIKNPVFSNLSVNDKTGAVEFRLTFSVDPAMLSYERFIASVPKSSTEQLTP